jgi:hypothetical protein
MSKVQIGENMDKQDAQDKALFTGRCAGSAQNVGSGRWQMGLYDEGTGTCVQFPGGIEEGYPQIAQLH